MKESSPPVLPFTEEQRNQAIEVNLPYVRDIAASIQRKLPIHVELTDLVGSGIDGLLYAAEHYDCAKEVSFRTYAEHRIRGAIKDGLRNMDTVSRMVRKKGTEIRKKYDEIEEGIRKDPSSEQLSLADLITEETKGAQPQTRAGVIAFLRNNGAVISLDHPVTDGGSILAEQLLASNAITPEESAIQNVGLQNLAAAISQLKPNYRRVIEQYYGKNEPSMKEIGENLGFSLSRVSQLHQQALKELRTSLSLNGNSKSAAAGSTQR